MRTSPGREDFDEFDVDPPGEMWIGFDLRAEAEDVAVGQPRDEGDAVRIAHRDAGDAERLFGDGQGDIDGRPSGRGVAGQGRGNCRVEDRRTHVDADAADAPGRRPQLQRQDAGARLDRATSPGGTAMVVEVLGHAAEPLPHISASEPSALNIRIRASAARWADQDQPVAADAEMPVRDFGGPARSGRAGGARRSNRHRYSHCLRLHLGETHRGNLPEREADNT